MIREVILENFMSYKYARIPFSPGINIITGPNGSGKSSILLGIAVALGQTYTERGRRLRDLIRRGEEVARVTVVLDNTPRNGKRPLPWFRGDEVYFTRYVRSDGTYWHEVNGRVVPRAEVQRYLRRVGLNPDNMLIIMHQNMVEEFAYLSPKERLRMVEDAIGLGGFRQRIKFALERLEAAKAEEKKVSEMLAKAEETLSYWRGMYERYLEAKRIDERLAELRRERAWALVRDKEVELREVREREQALLGEVEGLSDRIAKLRASLEEVLSRTSEIEARVAGGSLELLGELRSAWMSYAEDLAELKVAEYALGIKRGELSGVRARRRRVEARLRELIKRAEELGPRVETDREVREIEEEIRSLELRRASLGDVSESAVEAYTKYLDAYEELRRRAEEVIENRRRALEELKKRVEVWRSRLLEVVESVRASFREFLAAVGAVGDVRVVNIDDFEGAGLEIVVGFKGADPAPLDPYLHSGGERTTAVMCFLLALQDHVKSPVRAVDEFDVHMDPVNRNVILSLIFELARRNRNIQYIIITPGPLRELPEDANVILVQKVRRVSLPTVIGRRGLEGRG